MENEVSEREGWEDKLNGLIIVLMMLIVIVYATYHTHVAPYAYSQVLNETETKDVMAR